jgi:hypothetical protein
MRKAPRDPEPAKRWTAFLNNHREAMAAMDFFTRPTLTFGVLYCFFVMAQSISHFGPRSTVKAVLNFMTKPFLSRIVLWRATSGWHSVRKRICATGRNFSSFTVKRGQVTQEIAVTLKDVL